MIINFNTKFVIYGASLASGCYCASSLVKVGFSVLSFIDQNAAQIIERDGVPVYTLDKLPFDSYHDMVVVVSVLNRFEHFAIAKNLSEHGFPYILFQERYTDSMEKQNNDELFQLLLSASCVNENNIKDFLNKKVFPVELKKRERNLILNESDEKITTYVPSFLLFSDYDEVVKEYAVLQNPEVFKYVEEQFLYFHELRFDLFDAFHLGTTEVHWNEHLSHRKEYISGTFSHDIDEEALANNLRTRYDIFQNMEQCLQIDPQFFQRNPLTTIWNEKGFFNILNGNHRACFLLSKGQYIMPCEMSKRDYEKWVNSDFSKKIETFFEKNHINVRYPVAHPIFMDKPAREESFSYRKLMMFCQFLRAEKSKLSDFSVLDMDSDSGFFSFSFRHFVKSVIAIEPDASLFQLSLLLQDLFCADNVTFQKNLQELPDKKYDISIAKHHSKNLKDIAHYTKKYMFYDVDVQENNIDEILGYGFSSYLVLKTIPLYDRLYQICVFMK